MRISKAITLQLGKQMQPVITSYEVGKIIFELYVTKKFQNESIGDIKNARPHASDYSRLVGNLVDGGILSPNKNFSSRAVFNILGRTQMDAEDVICTVDPFCYISHLSAMAYHGLTNRDPQVLFVSTPSPKEWSEFSHDKMVKELKENFQDYIEMGFPKLVKISCNKLQGKNLSVYSSKHLGAYKLSSERAIRVSTIGRTFIDMVREPSLCGGMRHVVDCYEEYAKEYSILIISEAEQHANAIEKARIGYLLDVVCKINNNILDEWSRHTIRGGSRKLDPGTEYSSTYSEKWSISINL